MFLSETIAPSLKEIHFAAEKKTHFAQAFHPTALRLLRISENWPKAKKALLSVGDLSSQRRSSPAKRTSWCGRGQGRKSRNVQKNQKTNHLRSICSLLNWGLVSYMFLTQSIKVKQITHWNTLNTLRIARAITSTQITVWFWNVSNSKHMQGHWQAL